MCTTYCGPLSELLQITIYGLRIYKGPSKQHLVEKFNNTFRSLEDILALDNNDFNIHTKDIYPVELSLNTANIDLSVHIENGKFNT